MAYLMRYQQATRQMAYRQTKERRPKVEPNIGFWAQLLEYEDILRTLWRGRWQQPKMLGHYVQQLNCAKVLQRVPAPQRAKLDEWNKIFTVIVKSCWH